MSGVPGYLDLIKLSTSTWVTEPPPSVGICSQPRMWVTQLTGVTVLVFYVGYVIFELPSNIVLKKLGAGNWLSILGVAWGLISLGIGFSKNWGTVAVLRVLLGVLEAVSLSSHSTTFHPDGTWPGDGIDS